MRRQAKDDFRHDERRIERRADGERAVETGRRRVMMVPARAVVMPGVIVMVVISGAGMASVVVIRHSRSCSAGTGDSTLPTPSHSSYPNGRLDPLVTIGSSVWING